MRSVVSPPAQLTHAPVYARRLGADLALLRMTARADHHPDRVTVAELEVYEVEGYHPVSFFHSFLNTEAFSKISSW